MLHQTRNMHAKIQENRSIFRGRANLKNFNMEIPISETIKKKTKLHFLFLTGKITLTTGYLATTDSFVEAKKTLPFIVSELRLDIIFCL